MDERPLDYARPEVQPPDRLNESLTLGLQRFRRRSAIVILNLVILGCIPYPTKVCPSLNFRTVDDRGAAVTDVLNARWEGHCTPKSLHGDAPFDMTGTLVLPRQYAWASTWTRAIVIVGGLLPHVGSGLRDVSARVRLNIPRDRFFDAAATGLTPDGTRSMPDAEFWIDPRTGDRWSLQGDVLDLEVTSPGSWSSDNRSLALVLPRRPTAAATTVPTWPSSAR